jgi:cytochrome P450
MSTVLIVTWLTYVVFKPLICGLFYAVPYEPTYIHSYMPLIGFGQQMFNEPIEFVRSLYERYGKAFAICLASKRWVYLYDEQTYLTKVLRSTDLSIDEFFTDILVNGLNIRRQCATNETIQKLQLQHYHQYLVGINLEILNRRVHDSLLSSMQFDCKQFEHVNQWQQGNLFELFGEFMLLAGTEGLFGHTFTMEQRQQQPNFYRLFQDFDHAYRLGVFGIPLRTYIYRHVFRNRNEFIRRFSSLTLNQDESQLIHVREELFRSDEYKHLFSEYDIGALQASLLWAAVANTAPMSCWTIVDLFLHPQALQAVNDEFNRCRQTSMPIYDREFLSQLKILDSCIQETMRRIMSSVSTRQAMTNTTIECSDKTKIGLRKGDMLIYPAFLKHFDVNLFGPNPYEYQYDRFVRKLRTNKMPSLKLFGYGKHTCPGQQWAINEIKILVLLILQHMDIQFVQLTDIDQHNYRKKLPYDYSKWVSSGGPKKGHENKFLIRYSYKNLAQC